jgi:cytochrome c oxidase assembly protein subunit 15
MVEQNMLQTNFKSVNTMRRCVLLSILLAIVVIGLGAYTRLTHAGLGCPDWPTCYGLLDVPQTSEQIAIAEKAFPERAVETEKAWNEMIHRYFAGSLGLLIAFIAFLSVKLRFTNKLSQATTAKTPLILPVSILFVVTFQAALGMWTVTMKLMPIVVMGHLLGGFTTLCLLFLLHLRLRKFSQNNLNDRYEPSSLASPSLQSFKKYVGFASLGVVILASQIALGGWTSSNYAALSCVELPICQGDWQSQLSFSEAFTLLPPEKDSYEFGHLDYNERMTIHVAHRFGAIITTVYLAWLAIILFKNFPLRSIKSACAILMLVLIAQVSLGISNIWFKLPLNVAVAHNLVAAILMLSLLSLTYQLTQRTRGISDE